MFWKFSIVSNILDLQWCPPRYMQDVIAIVLKSNIDKLVEASPFFSLLINELMSVIMKILLLMLGHWMNLNHWENINVQEGKAKTITTALNLLMERRNLHKDNMTGFSRDGASFMTGKNEWRTIVHFLCVSTVWLTGLLFAQAKRLMLFLIWQNSKRS